jgi:hypothetical protein
MKIKFKNGSIVKKGSPLQKKLKKTTGIFIQPLLIYKD